MVGRLDLALTVPLVFAVAASTFCPLLVLGIWWRGLTASGAIAGVLVGGMLSTTDVLASLLAPLPPGLFGRLLYRPAIVTVPVAFLTMVIVSWRPDPRSAWRYRTPAQLPHPVGLTHDRLRGRYDGGSRRVRAWGSGVGKSRTSGHTARSTGPSA